MKQNRLHRGMALLLAVCMMLTLHNGFAFAAEKPPTCTCPPMDSGGCCLWRVVLEAQGT